MNATLSLLLLEHRQLQALLRRCRHGLEQRRQQRAQARQLAGMSEHDLSDLGIGRSEIPHLLRDEPRGT